MSKLLVLTKILLKTNVLPEFSSSKKDKKHKGLSLIGLCVLLIFVFCSLGIPIIYALDSLLGVVPMENVLLSLLLPIAGVTSIVFGVFSIVNVFYLSKDVDYLLPMPLKAKDIMMSKFLVALINEYYILFVFILPCLIGIGIGVDADFMYYVYMTFVFLLLPIIPSVIIAFIVLLITKFTGILKNRDLFMYVSMGIVLVFAFSYSYIIQSFIEVDPMNVSSTLQDLENSIVPYFKMVFPFYNSAVYTLINFNNLNGLFAFISFFAFNLIALLLIYWLGDKLYLNTLTVSRGSKKKSEMMEKVVGDNDKNSSSFVWLLKKEWLIIKRTPIFMLNIVIIVFLMPIILIISFLFSITQSGIDLTMKFNPSFFENGLIYMIVLLFLLFFTSVSMAASTSISREGENAWVMKVIPVSYFKQINIKVLFAVVLDLIGAVLLGVVPIIVYGVPFSYVIEVFVPLSIIVVVLNYLNIFIDLKRPKLKWSEESAAVKQNLNGLISVLCTMGLCAVLGLIVFILYYFNVVVDVWKLSLIITLISGLILGIVVYLFYKNNDKLLDNVN